MLQNPLGATHFCFHLQCEQFTFNCAAFPLLLLVAPSQSLPFSYHGANFFLPLMEFHICVFWSLCHKHFCIQINDHHVFGLALKMGSYSEFP